MAAGVSAIGASSRNKLGEAFLADVYAKWRTHGSQALDRMIETDPGGFVRVVAQILPDKLEVDVKHTIARIERVIVDHRPVSKRVELNDWQQHAIGARHADPALTGTDSTRYAW